MGRDWRIHQFKYCVCVLDISNTDGAKCNMGKARSLVNARSLKLECARVLHEALLTPVVLVYGIYIRRGIRC